MELPCGFAQDPTEARRIAVTAAVFAAAPPTFFVLMTELFQSWMNTEVTSAHSFAHPNLASHLTQLGWLRAEGGLVRPCLQEAVYETIYNHVRETIQGEYGGDYYDDLLEWKESLVDWVRIVVVVDDEVNSWSAWLERCVSECYCRVRMDEIFDLVADYPDSHAAAIELYRVLNVTHLHRQLAHQLQLQLSKRLNHPGANTSQIIDVYINVIKVIGILDPTAASANALSSVAGAAASHGSNVHHYHISTSSSVPLLNLVAEPVRSYLRGRSDTVRCIITSLTDAEVGGDLYNELRRHDAKPLENVVVDSDDEEECPDMTWQPKPPLRSVAASWSQPRSSFGPPPTPPPSHGPADSDILAMLVSIYGSKELFVDEYRIMLADRLLASDDYNTDQAVHTLELLKLRFGEASMRNCEVMIKDMDDSKRTNANIRSSLPHNPVDLAMVSHVFWPPLQHESLKHHPRLQAQLDAFSAEYARLKNPRKLLYLEQLGTVQLELDAIEGRTVVTKEFSCTPLQATLIAHFEDKVEWTLEDLSNETGVPEHVLYKKMTFWVNHRVLVHSGGWGGAATYELASPDHLAESGLGFRDLVGGHAGGGSDAATGGGQGSVLYDDDDGLPAVSVSAQAKAEMEVYESYIVGMLTNARGGLQLLRIHGMLQMFVSGTDTKYNKTPAQLSAFLQLLCQQEKLECGPDGMYKLFNHPSREARQTQA